ncbi:MAG: glycosylhydrolase-like jelly roll fold domain-containing protein, partial [Candidatus Aminicenantales bacterium]
KIEELIREGATVIGNPPRKSPSLEDFPDCDLEVEGLAKNMWGGLEKPQLAEERIYGKGKIFWGGGLNPEVVKSDSDPLQARLYPDYQTTAGILEKIGLSPDFSCSSGKIRYTHRSLTETEEEIYFISNRSGESVDDVCTFRDGSLRAELWDPLSGERRPLDGTQVVAPAGVRLEIRLEPEQSFFIVFKKDSSVAGPHNLSTGISSAPGNAMKDGTTAKKKTAAKNQSLDQIAGSGQFVFKNFPQRQAILTLGGPWKVKFDPAWGGPGEVVFEQLLDWAIHPDDGIRYYSGTAVYTAEFDLPEGVEISRKDALYLDLGEVFCLARVKLNGREQGIVWAKPARVRLTGIKKRGNHLEIEVANLWINRLIGDENQPWDGVVNGRWPEWLLIGSPRPTKRLTFTTHHFYRQGDPLFPSGLLGPVRLLK